MTARRTLGGSIVALAMSVLLSTAALGSDHLASEREGEQAEAEPAAAKIIVITPADHVMLVGGSRRLDAQICNEAGERCKDVGRKATWKVKPKNGLALRPKKGPSANATGKKEGTYTVTVTQGKTVGSTTVKVNAPREREPVEVAETRLVSVPEHPIVAEGHPYAMAFYDCPRGVTVESVLTDQAPQASGYRFIQNDGTLGPTGEAQVMADVGRILVNAGCTPADIAQVTPDAGFRVVYVRGNEMVAYKEEGAEGFSVQITTEDGESVFPSDKAAYFGADAVDLDDLPGLEGVDVAELEQEFIDQFDVNDDGALSMADIIEYDRIVEQLDLEEADEIDLEPNQEDRMREAVDIDGDVDWGTDEDRRLLVDTIGDLLLDLLLNDTPVEC